MARNPTSCRGSVRHPFDRTHAAGKASGILAPAETDARRYMDRGVNFPAAGSDLGLFRPATQSLRDKYIAAA